MITIIIIQTKSRRFLLAIHLKQILASARMPVRSHSNTRMPWLFILFVLVPAVELYILIQIGQVIGGLNTFLLILATGFTGSWLAKSQGLAVWRSLNDRFSRGEIPGRELMDGAIILVCGALLLTPGVITDVVGLLGLLPGTRTLFRKALAKVFTIHPVSRVGVHFGSQYNSMRSSTSSRTHSSTTEVSSSTVSGSPKSRPSHADTV